MAIKENDIGKVIPVNAKFDLSGNTELSLVFVKPDGTKVTKTSVHGVTAPSVDGTFEVDGVDTKFNADEYWQYTSETGLFDQTGKWFVYGIYEDGTPKNLAGISAQFTVHPR